MVKTNNSAPKGKEKTEKMNIGAKGGTNKMAAQQGVAPSKPGQVSVSSGSPNNKWGIPNNVGKSGVMGKQRGAAPAVSGQVSSGGRGGDNSFKVSGGNGHMAGFSASPNAKPV